MNIYGFLSLVSSIFALILGVIVLKKGEDRKVKRDFFLWCLTIFVWLFSYFICYTTSNKTVSILFARFACTAVLFLANTFYQFIVDFLKLSKERRRLYAAHLISFVLFFLFLFSDLLLAGTYKYFWGYYSKAGPLHPVFLAFFFAIFIRGFFILWKQYRKTKAPQAKYQLKYVFISFLIALFAAIDFIPKYHVEFYPFGFLFMLFFITTTAYAISKYNLMNIKIVVSKTVSFLIAYPFLLGIPFFLAYRIYPFAYPALGVHWWLIPGGLIIFFATVAPLAYAQIRNKIENKLLAEQKRYQKLLLQAAKGMATEHNLEKLSKLIVYIVKRIVRIKFAVIFIQNKDSSNYKLTAARKPKGMKSSGLDISFDHPLIKFLCKEKRPLLYEEVPASVRRQIKFNHDINLIIPSFMEKELVGFVFLGQKINMQPYTNDDIEIFQILANQAGLAIENCIFMQEFKQAQEKIFSAEKLASIGGMADGIAHQIKNRLNHFSVAAGELKMELEYINSKKPILQKDKDIKKSMDYVTQIAKSLLDNVKRTDQTVKGVLNYARTSEKDNFFTVFSLSEIIKLSTDLLKVKHHLKQAPLDERIKVDEIYGIKAQIMEVVYNLMDNSYEAILEKKEVLGKEKAKGYKPQIKIAATENTKNYILTFSDNGIGVKDEDQLKIFAPFFTTKTSYKQTQSGKSGTGIGMYIVKRLIEEAHHGHIWFESQYLQGTTFHIFLPKKKT